MVNKIQIRGISRTPSDRMTQDGGCSQSVNVMLDNSEVLPATRPKKINAEIGLPEENVDYNVLYIHKTSSYTNYILLDIHTGEIGIYKEDGKFYSFLTLEHGEKVNDITSLGNVLMIMTGSNMHYTIFDTEYVYLGNQVPSPDVEFNINVIQEYDQQDANIEGRHKYRAPISTSLSFFSSSEWASTSGDIVTYKNILKGFLNDLITENIERGTFYAPMFVRYAVRLYDGSYIRQSVPVLMAAGKRHFFDSYVYKQKSISTYRIGVIINSSYSLNARLLKFDVGNWGKYIQSIDFFVSPMIKWPDQNEEIAGIGSIETDNLGNQTAFHFYGKKYTEEEEQQAIEDLMVSKPISQFYRIASFSVDDFVGFIGDTIPFNTEVDGIKELVKEEILVTQPTLTDDYLSNNSIIAEKGMVFNNRFLFTGVRSKLYSGYPFMNATCAREKDENPLYEDQEIRYEISYFIQRTDGTQAIVRGIYTNGLDVFLPYAVPSGGSGGLYTVFQQTFGWLVYPDPNCIKAEIIILRVINNSITKSSRVLEMKPHPNLWCAYAYIGIDKRLYDYTVSPLFPLRDPDPFTYNDNKIYQSEAANPFTFPAAGIYTVSQGSIIGMATTTTALSTGQFGQFPLYVFSTDGIWALETASDGSFSKSNPVSRDVVTNADMITPIDQAIVFLTQRGVMILSGSNIRCISDNMRGESFTIPESLHTLLQTIPEIEQDGISLEESYDFFGFMKSAFATYDYDGNRMIFLCPGKTFAFVYMFATQTWHTMTFPTGTADKYDSFSALNSYPDCYINATRGDINDVLNLSTRYDEDAVPLTGLVVTRVFDLGEPDILKVIKDIRLRGKYSGNKLQYILMGSNDGVNFSQVTSLGKSSRKYYRMIIVSELGINEAFSWVDVEYDTRFNNKLR